MPRRGKVVRRSISPDPKYNSVEVAKFINKFMVSGKKALAERIVYQAFDMIAEEGGRAPLDTFEQALKRVTPILETKARRVGGATYQVPVEIRSDRRDSLAMRWLIQAVRSRQGRSMAEKLAAELQDAVRGQGAAIKKREDTHRMAEANKAFAHYRW
ncbi:MAG: 30S ribosomal protein S7 [Chloroflexi bacterium]|nr:30S ribosomal protein S7 [Chloroflexota bacterium]